MKRAIIYYSLTSNTKSAAEKIAEGIKADLIRIETVKPMPEGRNIQIMEGGRQAVFGLCPKIMGLPTDLSAYDEIILGMPVWAGRPCAPMNNIFKCKDIIDKVGYVFTLAGSGDNTKCIKRLEKKLPHLKKCLSLADNYNELSKKNDDLILDFINLINE